MLDLWLLFGYCLVTKFAIVTKKYTLLQEIENKNARKIKGFRVMQDLKNHKKHTGSVEATGSSPVCSTQKKPVKSRVSGFRQFDEAPSFLPVGYYLVTVF